MNDLPQPRTRWRLPRVRVSVRALMGVVLVLGVLLGWYVRSVRIQREAVAAIRRAGGSFAYDWQWGHREQRTIVYTGKPRAPSWLASIVPADYVANVVLVDLALRAGKRPDPADDETLAHVGRLGHLESLELSGTAITDAGLAHLKGLTGLRRLTLDRTLVSDAGLAHLEGMTSLTSLNISGSRITDEGILALERASPRLWITCLEEWPDAKAMSRSLADLDFARSQPVRPACMLLVLRARAMADRREIQDFLATINALCDLEASDNLSLIRLAEARAGCLGLIDSVHMPGLAATQRQALRQRCTDRAIEAVSRAIELGYDNIRRFGDDPDDVRHDECRGFWNLRDDPAFQKLIGAMKARGLRK
jgi:Leucine Rich repeat